MFNWRSGEKLWMFSTMLVIPSDSLITATHLIMPFMVRNTCFSLSLFNSFFFSSLWSEFFTHSLIDSVVQRSLWELCGSWMIGKREKETSWCEARKVFFMSRSFKIWDFSQLLRIKRLRERERDGRVSEREREREWDGRVSERERENEMEEYQRDRENLAMSLKRTQRF